MQRFCWQGVQRAVTNEGVVFRIGKSLMLAGKYGEVALLFISQ